MAETATFDLPGTVYLWRYLENIDEFPGWHTTADEEACSVIHEVLSSMLEERQPASARLSVCPPTPAVLSIPENKEGTARWHAPKGMTIVFDPTPEANDSWELLEEGDMLTVSLGEMMLVELAEAFAGLASGAADYCIGSSGEPGDSRVPLWFWSMP